MRPRLDSSRARVFPSAPPASLSYARRSYAAPLLAPPYAAPLPRAPLGFASPGCSGARPRAAHPAGPHAAVRPKRRRSDPRRRLAPLPLHLRYYPLLRSLLCCVPGILNPATNSLKPITLIPRSASGGVCDHESAVRGARDGVLGGGETLQRSQSSPQWRSRSSLLHRLRFCYFHLKG